MTQAELAEKADLSHDYIRQIESEKIANTFSVQTIYDISVFTCRRKSNKR